MKRPVIGVRLVLQDGTETQLDRGRDYQLDPAAGVVVTDEHHDIIAHLQHGESDDVAVLWDAETVRVRNVPARQVDPETSDAIPAGWTVYASWTDDPCDGYPVEIHVQGAVDADGVVIDELVARAIAAALTGRDLGRSAVES